ncbi:MAG: hypothetical protein ACSHUF_00035 [Candidatus Nasuia deltocephalinicola]
MIKFLKLKKDKIINIIKIFKIVFYKNKEKIFFIIKKKFLKIFYYSKKIKLLFKIKKKFYICLKYNFFINFKSLEQILKNTNDNTLKIQLKKNLIKRNDNENNGFNYFIKHNKKKYKKLKKIFEFSISKKDIKEIIYISENIIKSQNENYKLFNLLIKNNKINFIITDNYQIINYKFINNKNFIFRLNFSLDSKIINVIKFLINNVKKKIKIKLFKKFLKFNILNLYIKLKIIKKKIFYFNISKKKFVKYIFLKKALLNNILEKFSNSYKNDKILKFSLNNNLLKILKRNNLNKKEEEFIKLRYKFNKLEFLIDGEKLSCFLKNINCKDLIFNFSKKSNLIITIPKKKNLKYFIKIIII